MTPAQQAELLRVYQLAFIRMGKPSEAIAASIEKILDPVYPAPMASLNRELCTLLVYLESPNAAVKTLALMSQSTDQAKHNWSNDLLNRNAACPRVCRHRSLLTSARPDSLRQGT